MRIWGIAALVLATLAAAGAPPDIRVRAGFAGQHFDGRALPVAVEIQALDTAVAGNLQIPVGDDPELRPDALYTTPVEVPAGGLKTWRLVVTHEISGADLLVEVVDRNRSRYRKTVTLRGWSGDTRLVVTVNNSGGGLRFLKRDEPPTSQPAPGVKPPPPGVAVANLTAAELPSSAAGLEAVTLLVLNDESFTAVDDSVRAAVEAYVRGGGHLVLVGGPAAAGLWQDSLIRRLSPVAVSGLRAFSGDEAGQLARSVGQWRRPAGSYAGAAGRLVRGEVLCGTAAAPLLATCQVDRGRVIFLALPYDQAPLRDWPGLEQLWRQWLAPIPVTVLSRAECWRPFYGLAARFSGVELPAVSTVAAFLVAYLVVLVPLQFGLLARYRRRELAWVCTPLIVLVFSVGAYLLGGALRGQRLHTQASGLLLAHRNSRTAQLLGLQAIYSPDRRRYDLRPPVGTQRLALLATSQGGGVYDGSAVSLAKGERYVVETTPRGVWLPQLPVQMWSARTVGFDSPISLPSAPQLQVRRRGATAAVLTARQPWPEPLLASALVYGDAVHRLGTLPPQQARKWPLRLPPAARRAGPNELCESLRTALAGAAVSNFAQDSLAQALSSLLRVNGQAGTTPTGLDIRAAALWGWLEQPGSPFELGDGVRPAKAAQLYLVRIALDGPAP
ncbi:MAG: hypothetical protein IT204_13390 [Fimbriimonadaceae bacterium]|nr:hypothetical protein [Fimbriimonadaceae bacterium]